MKNLYICLSLLILIGLPFKILGQEYLGGFISYNWQGDTLLVNAIVYSNCKGGPIAPGTFRITNSNCGFDTSVAYLAGAGVDVTPLCNMQHCTQCSDTTCALPYGIARHELTAKVYLGHISCCGFDIQLKECCRSDMFTTIDNNQSFFLSAFTDKCSDNFSSPFFSGPSMLMCVGQCRTEAISKNDWTPNELRYRLVSPKADEDSAITYIAPYSYDKPLYFFGFPNSNLAFNPPQCRGFHLNSVTGEILYRPMQAQSTLMALKMEELDTNGIVTGAVTFDIPMIITNCPYNDAPMLTGINGSSSQYSTTVCPGEYLCFAINSGDDNTMDSVEMSWNAGIPGATFTVTQYGKYQHGRFCWTPTKADESSVPYFFTVTAKDNACPISKTTVRTFQILVKDCSVSVEEPDKPQLKIYPNPAKDIIQVELPQNITSYTAQFLNAEGKLVKKLKTSADTALIIQREGLPAGVYYLELRVEGQNFYYPVVFQ